MKLALLLVILHQWIADQGGRAVQNAQGEIIEVDLTSTWISDADLAPIGRLSSLHKLTLAHTKITDVGFEHLKPLENVRELDCHFCEYITEDGIASLRGWRHLEVLNLRGTKVTSKVFEHLAQIASLRELDVAHTQIEDEGFDQLSALAGLSRLAIGGNRLEGSALSMLKLVPSLRALDVGGIQRVDSGLWGLPLTDANLKRLAELQGLISLNLSGANLADRGLDRPGHPEAERSELRDLQPLAQMTQLEVLDLSRTPVLSSALAALKSLPRLRELRLGLARRLDDSALDTIAEFKSLRVLHVEGAPLSAEALDRFRKRRPDCQVWR